MEAQTLCTCCFSHLDHLGQVSLGLLSSQERSQGVGPSRVGGCAPLAWCTDRERQVWTWPQLVLTCLRKTKGTQAVLCLPGSSDTGGSRHLTEAPKTRTSDWLSLAWRI